jgi:probable blue pigment (indigoidine) exporter
VSTSAERAGQARFVSNRTEGIALLLVTACSWGLTWPFSKYLLTMLPPFSMRTLCGAVGCVIAFGLAALRRERLIPPAPQWGRLLLFSLLNYGAFIALTAKALAWLTASEAVVITYTLPIWAAILAWPMLGERPTLRQGMAILLGLGGVALMVDLGAVQTDPRQLPGAAMALGAAILFALGTVIAKRHPLALPPITSVAWQAMLGIIPVGLLALTESPRLAALTQPGWAAILYISIFPMTIAYLTWFRALRLVSAATAATTVLISPMIGVIGSTLMLGDTLGPRQIVALLMTLSGVALAARS